MITLTDVSKSYDGVTDAVRHVSLHVDKGELLVLLGESGCGKTTTMKMINRLIEPTSGKIEVDGRDVMQSDPIALRRGIGYVFQRIGLFPHRTVGENVSTVPRLLGWSDERISDRVDELLDLIKLHPGRYRDRFPHELSGGEQQRVGLARAVAASPAIMLMDEPFGALDPLRRDALREEFRRLQRQLELTTVLVTHDMTEALLLADRIALMRGGELVQTGTPGELLRRPADPYVGEMLGTPKKNADRLERLAADGDLA